MALIPITLPPGMYRNGTEYSRRMRWEEGNHVRWHNGTVQPIGGWLRRQNSGGNDIAALISDPTLEAVRDIFAWRDNSQNRQLVFGSNLALYHVGPTGTVTDITYGGYSPLNSGKDASLQAGFGQNPYGTGAYGVANNLIGADPNPPDRWYFANFGEILLTGVRGNGTVYELDLTGPTLSAVTNAPSSVQDLCVTQQRQVLAVGGAGQPRRLQTTDTEDRTDWTPATANQSVDRVIAGSGTLLRCVPVLNEVLLLGETDATVARYIGPPYVYSTDIIGENCGMICAEAVAKTDRFAVWWGSRNFWLYDGALKLLDCDVIDFLYEDIDTTQVSKIQAFTVTEFSEVWWLYQSTTTTTTEVDSYVVWDYKENHWYTGRIDRTAGFDAGALRQPVMVNADGEIFNHELPGVFPENEGSVYVQSGPIDLKNGEQNLMVRYIYPDAVTTSDLTFEIIGRQFPNATEYTYGPYSFNNPVPTRGTGRSIKLKGNFQQAGAKLGIERIDVAPMGAGRR